MIGKKKFRMKQLVLNLFFAASFLAFAAAAFVWVRSYWIADFLLWRSNGFASFSIAASRGSVDVMRAESKSDAFEFLHFSADQPHFPRWADRDKSPWQICGFGYFTEPDINHATKFYPTDPPIPCTEVIIPIWSLVLIFGILPTIKVYHFLTKGPLDVASRCPACGYDLRATPNRCPECGKTFTDAEPGLQSK